MARPEGGRSAALPPSRAALIVSSLLLVAVTADVLLRGPLSWFDGWSADWLRANFDLHHHGHRERAELVPLVLTQFGSPGAIVFVVAPWLALVCVRRRTIRPLARLAVLGLLVGGVVVTAKAVVGRTAPMVDLLWTDAGRSYPSGHAVTAVVAWGLAAWVAAEGPSAPVRRVTRVLRWLGPLCTGVGMFLLVYHWFTDVVAGAALGVLLLWVLHVVDRMALAHLPGADRGIAGVGDAARVDAVRDGARDGGRRGSVHDPRPANR